LIDRVILVVMSPSAIASSTPVTVTVWGVFQFDEANVSDVLSTVISVVSPLVTAMTTLDVGWTFRTTVKLSAVPVSGNRSVPAALGTMKPSSLVTDNVAGHGKW